MRSRHGSQPEAIGLLVPTSSGFGNFRARTGVPARRGSTFAPDLRRTWHPSMVITTATDVNDVTRTHAPDDNILPVTGAPGRRVQ